MASREKFIAKLKKSGFASVGATKHANSRHEDGMYALVPRHKNLNDYTCKKILKDAKIDD